MNRKKDIFMIIFLFILIVILFLKIDTLRYSAYDGMQLFIKNVFPFLYIMIIINKLFLNYNFPYYLHKIFKSNIIYIMFMSAISGSPINAIIIKEYLYNNAIDSKSASYLLCFTTFNNPLFIYSYLDRLLNSNYLILKSIIFIYFSNILVMLFLRKKILFNQIDNKNRKMNYKQILESSINDVINIFATFIIFKVLTDLIFVDNSIISSLLKGIIEITQGLESLTFISVPIIKKSIISLIIITFSGLSIHIQISNILKDYNINYLYFYITKILLIIIILII